MTTDPHVLPVVLLGMNRLSARCAGFLKTTAGFDLRGVVSGVDVDALPAVFRAPWDDTFLRSVPRLRLDALKSGTCLGVSVGYPSMLSPSDLAKFKSAPVNLHLGPLPWYRGALSAISFALLEGASEYGVTLHQIDDGLDTGPVFATRAFPLQNDSSVTEVLDALECAAYELFETSIEPVLRGCMAAVPQVEMEGASGHRARTFRRSDTEAWFDLSDESDINMLMLKARALSWPERRPYVRLSDSAVIELHFRRVAGDQGECTVDNV